MKLGLRSRSFNKSISAMTTGRLTRTVKKNINPLYGKSGINKFKNPKKYIDDKIYHKFTIGMPGTGLKK